MAAQVTVRRNLNVMPGGAKQLIVSSNDVSKFGLTRKGKLRLACQADHERDWQTYPVDVQSAVNDDHTVIRPLHQYRVGHLGLVLGKSCGTLLCVDLVTLKTPNRQRTRRISRLLRPSGLRPARLIKSALLFIAARTCIQISKREAPEVEPLT